MEGSKVNNLVRRIFLGFVAAVLLGAGSAARAQEERAVIHVVVDENGRTVVSCEGAECETVDCSGNGQVMAVDSSYVIQEEAANSCSTGLATGQETEDLDLAQQEITELLLAGPIPGGGEGELGQAVDDSFLQSGESNQQQVGDTGEGSNESPNEL